MRSIGRPRLPARGGADERLSTSIRSAAALARFIYGSVDERFQRGVYYLTTAGCKRPLPHFLLGKRDFSLFFSRFGL